MTDSDPDAVRDAIVDRELEQRDTCLAAWPEAQSGRYDPRCYRFPKSCGIYRGSVMPVAQNPGSADRQAEEDFTNLVGYVEQGLTEQDIEYEILAAEPTVILGITYNGRGFSLTLNPTP